MSGFVVLSFLYGHDPLEKFSIESLVPSHESFDLFIHICGGVETHIIVLDIQLHHHLQSIVIPYMASVCGLQQKVNTS